MSESEVAQIKISIIMPVRNEARILRETLSQVKLTPQEELIVVDGGSTDNTVTIAREFTDKVYTAQSGRGRVMNFGARAAEGDILLFLHADSYLPDDAFTLIRSALGNHRIVAGAFALRIDHKRPSFRAIEYAANLRARLTSLIYGDQGMFLRKDVFEAVGGFADIPLMEDIEISQKLKKKGEILFLRQPIRVSPRRWLNEGICYTTLRDWMIASLYTFLKVSPERLINYYREVR